MGETPFSHVMSVDVALWNSHVWNTATNTTASLSDHTEGKRVNK